MSDVVQPKLAQSAVSALHGYCLGRNISVVANIPLHKDQNVCVCFLLNPNCTHDGNHCLPEVVICEWYLKRSHLQESKREQKYN